MLWNRLKSYAMVTAVTLVIWAFAEAESLRAKQISAEVLFQNDPSGDRVVDVPGGQGWHGRVDLTVEGSAAGLDRLQSRLNRTPITLGPGDEGVPGAGEAPIDLRLALRAHPALREMGVTITKADPPTLNVRVDQIETRELRVDVQAPDGELDGLPEVKPATVRVKLPKSEAANLGPDDAASVKIDSAMLSKLIAGRAEPISGVPVLLPPALGARARAEPPTVDVLIKLRSRTGTFTVASVPVQVRIAAAELGKWDVEIAETDRFIKDVKVTGPSDLVNQVRTGELKIVATLALGFEELEKGITSKEVSFSDFAAQLPLKFEAENRLVRLTITRRPDPAN